MVTSRVTMTYTRPAGERAMKVAEVLLHTEVLAVSAYTVRRLHGRYEHTAGRYRQIENACVEEV